MRAIKSKQRKLDSIYINMATEWAKMSNCKRRKVGCLIVKDNTIISDGINGTPSGMCNDCEDENGLTKDIVLHAESNAISKLAKSSQSSRGATLYITFSPCLQCSKLIIQSGITRVVYKDAHSEKSGLFLLGEAGIYVEQLSKTNMWSNNIY